MRSKTKSVKCVPFFLTTLFLILWWRPAQADTLDPLSPLLIGVAQGNDNLASVSSLLIKYNLSVPDSEDLPAAVTLLGKYERDDNSWETGGDYFTMNFYTPSIYFEGSSFVWATTGSQGYWRTADTTPSGDLFFSVKAGNDYALYYAGEPGESFWSTGDLGYNGNKMLKILRQMSHISFWTTGGTPTDPPAAVPEPGTLMLLGLGLLGLAPISRISRGALPGSSSFGPRRK